MIAQITKIFDWLTLWLQGFILKAGSLGNKNYDRKVFNNIWGTFTFGPENSFYLGTYRGFIRVSSD